MTTQQRRDDETDIPPELAHAAASVRALANVPPPPGDLAAGRAAFVAAGQAAAQSVPRPSGLAGVLPALRRFVAPSDPAARTRRRWQGAVAAAAAVVALTTAGVATAHSGPGDLLFEVKRAGQAMRSLLQEIGPLRAVRDGDTRTTSHADRPADAAAPHAPQPDNGTGPLPVPTAVARQQPARPQVTRPAPPTAVPTAVPTAAPTLWLPSPTPSAIAPTAPASTGASVVVVPPAERRPTLVRWEGVLERADGPEWQVEGRAFFVGEGTIDARLGAAAVGARVAVEARRRDDALWLVRLTVLEAVAVPEIIEWSGVIEALAPDEWTVAGQVVRITKATRISGDPALGHEAFVEARVLPGGVREAIAIDVVPPASPTTPPTTAAATGAP